MPTSNTRSRVRPRQYGEDIAIEHERDLAREIVAGKWPHMSKEQALAFLEHIKAFCESNIKRLNTKGHGVRRVKHAA
jgi:hypothetical protein